ncbi:hypothetical protein C8024_15320 [Sphingopyxis sp. BSNA05]|uniref:hypothetical protein n=1 Tax=Sphingopyxis sp. BSNA05 TaxID=1236614 RepID=UPI001563D1FB|nr:hypothetical protein [Sphingopyxis sp. BSNA05]NRD90536.1 hypothetical protein [Sphingopyxis sp. BSNA05]
MVNNGFNNCEWIFEAEAQNTVRFLKALYDSGGGFREMVEATILVPKMTGATQGDGEQPPETITFSANTSSGEVRSFVTPVQSRVEFVTSEVMEARMGQLKAEIKSDFQGILSPIEMKLNGLPQSSTIWKGVGTIVVGMFGAVGAILAYSLGRVIGLMGQLQPLPDSMMLLSIQRWPIGISSNLLILREIL